VEWSFQVVSYNGSTLTVEGYDEDRYTFSARVSGGKLIVNGLDQLGYNDVTAFNGTYGPYEESYESYSGEK
jgi:hypothetical protein